MFLSLKMASNQEYVTMFIIGFLILVFIFTLTTSDPELMYSVGRTRAEYHYTTPILISPSAVQFIPRRTDDLVPVSYSPNQSIAPSTIYEVPIRTSQSIEQPPTQRYTFCENGRNFKYLGEKLCCKILEEYLGRQVQWNLRPNWLKNPNTNRNLELDLYDEQTKIAIEYNGYTHREPEQMARDKIKSDLCKKLGVKLIVVPDTVDYVKKNSKGNWIPMRRTPAQREELLRGYIVPFLDELCA